MLNIVIFCKRMDIPHIHELIKEPNDFKSIILSTSFLTAFFGQVSNSVEFLMTGILTLDVIQFLKN